MRNIFAFFLLPFFVRCKWHNTKLWKCEFLFPTLQYIAYRHNSLNSFIGFTIFRLTQRKITQTDTRFVWQSLKLMKLEEKLLHRQIIFIQFYIASEERGNIFWSIENDLSVKLNLPFDSFAFPCNQFQRTLKFDHKASSTISRQSLFINLTNLHFVSISKRYAYFNQWFFKPKREFDEKEISLMLMNSNKMKRDFLHTALKDSAFMMVHNVVRNECKTKIKSMAVFHSSFISW